MLKLSIMLLANIAAALMTWFSLMDRMEKLQMKYAADHLHIRELQRGLKMTEANILTLESRLQHLIVTSQPKIEPKRTRKKKDDKAEH